NYTHVLHAPALAPAPAYVRRAEEMIEADPVLENGLGGLADRLGISVRTLHEGFRRFRNTTPLHFVRMRRLERARESLRNAPPGTRVTDVALSVGYAHFGRFSAEYRARFGELPSATLRAVQGDSTRPSGACGSRTAAAGG
ncbi:MAG TPA: helix-turn-helix domain-containing protein, partial [Zeimonas sp.]